MDPTEIQERFRALAAASPEIAEIVNLPNLTSGYQQPATTVLGVANFDYNGRVGTFAGSLPAQVVTLASRTMGHQGGNLLTAQLVNPGTPSAPLAVSLTNMDLTVSLATDANGAPASTAAQIVAAINAHPEASALFRAAGSLQDAVEDREDLGLRAVADRERRLPGFDAIRGEILDAERAERRQEVRPDDGAVVDDPGRLAVEVELDVAQVLITGVGHRGAGSDHPRQRSRARLREDVVEPGLRGALRVVAGRRPSALGPCRADGLLDLTPVRQAVLGSPRGAPEAFEAVDVS